MKKLNKEQREFLEYIKLNHRCLGWAHTIDTILRTGRYDVGGLSKHDPMLIVRDFKKLLNGSTYDGYAGIYGKPTKYLNG